MADDTRLESSFFMRSVTADPAENDSLLPSLTTDYKAAGNADSEVSRFVVIMGKDGFAPGSIAYFAFQYVHLSRGEFSYLVDGHRFRFLIADLEPKLLTVHGRNLVRIFDYLSLRRIPWIRQTDRDFRAVGVESKEAVITKIELEDWEPAARN